MTRQATQHGATAGQDAGTILTGSNGALSPAAFAVACQQIVQQHEGHAAHRRLDRLVTELLSSLGYSAGMTIFIDHVRPYHDD